MWKIGFIRKQNIYIGFLIQLEKNIDITLLSVILEVVINLFMLNGRC